MTATRANKAALKRRKATLVAFCLISSAAFAQVATPPAIQQSHAQLADASTSSEHQVCYCLCVSEAC